jgi:uncharacterized membrane protein YhaH (DUF805 family)
MIPGRMGRLRYSAYMVALTLICGAALSMLLIMAVQIPGGAKLPAMRVASMGILYGVLPAGALYFTTLRAHDFGATGLSAWLVLIPFVGLVFLFWPGQPHENHFGPPPEANSRTLWLVNAGLWSFVLGCVAYAWLNGPVNWSAAPEGDAAPLTEFEAGLPATAAPHLP